MKKISEPIVFFGSGPVAAKSLQLLADDFEIEAVVTKPRPDHHRGDVPVLELASKLNLRTLTATNKRTLDELFATKPVSSKLAVLIDFGIIVSQQVIDYFPMGIINSHFSLLPEWRGADPITFAILSGQKETGVSLMLLSTGVDEGPLLAQKAQALPPDITTPQLTDMLIALSHDLLVKTIPEYLKGAIQPVEQSTVATPDHPLSYSRKLTKADGILDFTKSAEQLEREVRAFAGWPRSRTTLGNGVEVIITKAHVAPLQGKPGTTTIINKMPAIYCGNNALVIDRIQPAGKREMAAEAFLAGYKDSFLAKN